MNWVWDTVYQSINNQRTVVGARRCDWARAQVADCRMVGSRLDQESSVTVKFSVTKIGIPKPELLLLPLNASPIYIPIVQ